MTSKTISVIEKPPNGYANISVIVPAYNAEFSIRKCIDSVLSQSTPPREVIVINDGSCDKTKSILESYEKKIVYLEQQNQGQGAARNAGLAIANGEFIAFLDADDYWMPDFIENCVNFLNNIPEAVAVSTGLIIRHFDQETRVLAFPNKQSQNPNKPYIITSFFDFWAKHDHLRTGSNVIRRNVIENAGFQRADLRMSQDLEYWALIGTYGLWGYIPEPLWVGNSTNNSAISGWLKKYSHRRKMCPSVESWQMRIVPRLKQKDLDGFEKVRGRVAMNFVHTKILSKNYYDAYNITKKFSDNFPQNKMASLIKFSMNMRYPGFLLASCIIIIKEYFKIFRINCSLSKYRYTSSFNSSL